MFRFSTLTGLVSSLLLSSCATMTTDVYEKETLDDRAGGLTYFLPKRMVTLDVETIKNDTSELKKKRDTAETAKTNAAKAKSDKDAEIKGYTDTLAAGGLTSQASSDLQNKLSIAQAELPGLISLLTAALNTYNDAEQTYQAALSNPTGCQRKVKLTLGEHIPDMERHFVASPKHQIWRDDTSKLEVSDKGLLSSANVKATDRSLDILTEIIGATSLADNPYGIKSTDERTYQTCEDLRPFQHTFDPMAADSESDIDTLLGSSGLSDLKIEIDTAGATVKPVCKTGNANPNDDSCLPLAETGKPIKGLVYRSPAPVVLTLTNTAGDTERPIASTMVMLPQAGPTGFIPLEARAFVTTIDDVEFSNGSVKSWNIERPSELLEVVRLPVRIAKLLVSVPAELVKLRVDYSSDELKYVQQMSSIQAAQTRNQLLSLCLKAAAEDETLALECVDKFVQASSEPSE